MEKYRYEQFNESNSKHFEFFFQVKVFFYFSFANFLRAPYNTEILKGD